MAVFLHDTADHTFNLLCFQKGSFFKILWYSFISIVFMNVVATIYLFSK
ncbi:hypothetical protein HMPREF0023_2872 [Acinetobacter sp. ATCC 27244]|nr:hypothetical protein HMPREF0023_2872 [Acinetobacter sp. ATCC 27244]